MFCMSDAYYYKKIRETGQKYAKIRKKLVKTNTANFFSKNYTFFEKTLDNHIWRLL
jgi:hypothetical protein